MPVTLSPGATEESTYVIEVSFKDEDSAAVVPNSVSWSLTDDNGTVVNGRDSVAVASPASTITIVLSGDDLVIETFGVNRTLLIEAEYDSTLGSGLPLKDEAKFPIYDLVKVS
jgi:hypothetical protein